MVDRKYPKVPPAKISSLDLVSFDAGLDQRGKANIKSNSFSIGRNVMVNQQGLLTHRLGLKRWLPDLVETVYDIFPALMSDGTVKYFTADDGRIKYCEDGDSVWTDCGTADTPSTLTTSLTGSDNDLVYTAVQVGSASRGANGDNVTIAYIDPSANDATLSVVVTDTDIVVNLATDSGGSITSTAAEITTAIEASASASALVTVANDAGNDGSGVVTALSETNLASGADGSNFVTTGTGIVNTFLRTQDKLLILNGTDELGYVDLSSLEVVHFEEVADPAAAPTGAVTGLTGTDHKMYYAISYSGIAGVTATSDILTQDVSKIRPQWAEDGSEGVTVTDPNSRPTGARNWNLYAALAPAGSTIDVTDMIPLALGLDINTTTFFDNGQLDFIIDAGTAPAVNSTEGPKAKYGVEIEGRPFLYGITDDKYAVMIGGIGADSIDFSENGGGYRLVLNEGTNFYPQSVVGFRNGQGIPSITVLFSNTEGLSKQSIIEPNTISLGTYSITVWGQTEQNYGAAGVSSPYAVVNYKGKMVFPTTDGILKLDTQASLQNVLLPERISDPVITEVGSIKTELLEQIVGVAWANRIMFSIPSRGFNYNNEILVYDTTRKDKECWYVFNLNSQWIGTISPPGSAGFVYVCQDNHVFRLDDAYVAQDETSEGLTEAFPVQATTALIGTNTAHDGFYAMVQVVFYLVNFIGSVDLVVTWRDYQSGELKSKTKTVTNGTYTKSSVGNWSSPGYLYNQDQPTTVLRWGEVDVITDSQSVQKTDIRERVLLNNVVTNELQATVAINLDNSAVIARSISFQGQQLGISPDVR